MGCSQRALSKTFGRDLRTNQVVEQTTADFNHKSQFNLGHEQ